MGKRERENEDEGPSRGGSAPTIGQQTSQIANKIVRGAKYAKLKHEKHKSKKKQRAMRQKELERAEALGIEPPPKPVPKVTSRVPMTAALPPCMLPGEGRAPLHRNITSIILACLPVSLW